MDTFLLAMLAGLIVSAPPGPLGALCARTSVRRGPRAGMAVGCAIAAGEAVHASLAMFGGAKLDALPRSLRLVAGVALAALLLGLAWRAWSRAGAPRQEAPHHPRRSAAGTFLLALATPGTLPAFALCFTVFGLAGARPAVLVIAGAAAGSLAWWSLVSTSAHRLAARCGGGSIVFERACGALFLLGAFGALRAALL